MTIFFKCEKIACKGVFTYSILAIIVTILVSIVIILVSIEPILENCGHLQVHYSRVLHLQMNAFFKYWLNTREYYHDTFKVLSQYLRVLSR